MRISPALTIAAIVLALAGCQRTSFGTTDTSASLPPPVNPAPVGGVQGSQLPPPGAQPGTQIGAQQTSGSLTPPGAQPPANEFPDAPQTALPGANAQDVQTAAATAPDITRDELLGTWQTDVGGTRCEVFLSLTRWTGGYRGGSRGCGGEAANIAAWDVTGNQVVLNDRDGNSVARLYRSGPARYDGSLASGGAISFSR